jgi:hypothetical protein
MTTCRAALLLLTGLSGCVSQAQSSDPPRLAADKIICRGEVQKATLADGGPSISVMGAIAWNEAFAGCMAARGHRN